MSVTIWYVSKYVTPPGCGSVGGRGFLLMKELAQLGHRVSIITSDSNQLANPPQLETGYLFQVIDGIQICWVRTMKYKIAKSMRRILSWLHFEWRLLWLPKQKLEIPDVVIVSSLSLLTVLNGFLWKAQYRCRLIFEIRDIWPLTILEEGGAKYWNPFVVCLGAIEWLGYKYADAIVGTMPNLGEHVRSVLGYPKVVHCVPMGVEDSVLDKIEDLPIEYMTQNFPKEKFIVAYVGSIGISNALETFFECAESMKNFSHIHFLVVGDGDLRATYRLKYAHLLNLSFAPRVPKALVQSVLAQCDLLYFSVHASRVWQYGQSLNKIIDYMLAGKPVVASYTGYPSMINDARCGTFVPAENIAALQHEVQHYASMSQHERDVIGKRGRDWLLSNRQYKKLAEDYLNIMLNNNL